MIYAYILSLRCSLCQPLLKRQPVFQNAAIGKKQSLYVTQENERHEYVMNKLFQTEK